jgi:tetratricopeptide (TPR) repeat protein
MSKSIYELKKEFDELNLSDKLAFVQFYESNVSSIEKIDISKDSDHYNSKLRYICEYGMSLVSVGQFSKGVRILEKAIPMYEFAPNNAQGKSDITPYYEYLLWNYGLALYETNQIDNAIKNFKKLVLHSPVNDKYYNWLNGLRAMRIAKIAKPIWGLCFIWIVLEFTVFEKFNSTIQFKLAALGGLLLAIAGTLETIKYFLNRKKGTNAQQQV